MSPREKNKSVRNEHFYLDSGTLAVPEHFYTTAIIGPSIALPNPYTILPSDLQGLQSVPSTISTACAQPLEQSGSPVFPSHNYNSAISGGNLPSGSYPLQSNEFVQSNFHPWHDNTLQTSLRNHVLASETFESYDLSPTSRDVGLATTTLNRSRHQHALPSRSSTLRSSTLDARRPPHGMRPRRSGPLKRQVRQKADTMRDIGACWRCRKYKKSCNGPGICDSCLVPGFRVWPSDIGCRRERLQDLTFCILPANFERCLVDIPEQACKVASWRHLLPPDAEAAQETTAVHNTQAETQWDKLKQDMRSIILFGHDLDPLADIVSAYQSRRSVPNKCLEACGSLITATCNLYKCFVQCDPELLDLVPAAQTIAPLVSEVRIRLSRSMGLLSSLCLSTKRADWFPATLGASLVTCAAFIFTDTMMAVPSPVRELVWGDSHARRAWMREGSYGMLIDMLRASTKGVNPMKLQFSGHGETVDTGKASEMGVLLGDVDPAGLDGMRELKDWKSQHQNMMDQAKEMFRLNLYDQARVRTIGSLWLIYEW